MHAATVDLMTKKARFESETALAVAEAFDIAIQQAQLVTVSLLDVRLADLRSEIETRFVALEAKIEVRFAQQDQNLLAQFATAKSENDARFLALEARMNSLQLRMEAGFEVREERLEKKLESLKAEVVRWVFLVMLGNAAISAAVNALMNSFQHLR